MFKLLLAFIDLAKFCSMHNNFDNENFFLKHSYIHSNNHAYGKTMFMGKERSHSPAKTGQDILEIFCRCRDRSESSILGHRLRLLQTFGHPHAKTLV